MDFNTHAKSVIGITTCPIHHQKPLLAIIDKRIAIECCCRDFKITCLQMMVKLLTEHLDRSLIPGFVESDEASI